MADIDEILENFELLDEWDWSEHFSGQPEIERYCNFVADKFDLRRDIQFSARVKAADFDEAAHLWIVTLDDGSRHTARFLITAVGLLCLSLAKETDSKGFQASLAYLKRNLDYRDRYYPYYFEYYMSQALFHADDEAWNEWNARNIRYLATIQSPDGSFPGNQGPSFNTAGALLSLALNYRYLPIYEK